MKVLEQKLFVWRDSKVVCLDRQRLGASIVGTI